MVSHESVLVLFLLAIFFLERIGLALIGLENSVGFLYFNYSYSNTIDSCVKLVHPAYRSVLGFELL